MGRRLLPASESVFSLAVFFAAALLVLPAHAQTALVAPSQLDLQLFKPSMDSAGLLNLNVGGTGGHLTTRGGVWLDYSRRLLRTEIDGTDVKLGDVVGQRLDATAIATLGILSRFEIGVAMPFNIYQTGLDTPLVRDVIGKQELSKSGVSDLRLMAKGSLLTETDSRPALALVVEASVPTGDAEELRSEPSWTITPQVAGSKRFGAFNVVANLGYRHRNENARIYTIGLGDEFIYRLGGTYAIPRRGGPSLYSIITSLYGSTPTSDIFGFGGKDRAILKNSMELAVAGARRITTSVGNFRVSAGVGLGLLPGYGSPQVRGILSFDFLNREPFDDDDRDGIVNVNDKCPGVAEDLDDFEDLDGCPEIDNDSDGIEDIDDECPNKPEDKDNFEDFDGCPEVSELDVDTDGVDDAHDKCPDTREDFDGHEDEDGCFDPDNDGDGLTDISDLCPEEFEDQATSADKDGCPSGLEMQALAVLDRNAISTSAPVEFTEKGGVAPQSAGILNQVALLLREHNEIVQLTVQVTPMKNLPVMKKQAERRAKAVVDYLAARGVERARLIAEGDKTGPKPGDVRFIITKQLSVQGQPPAKPAPKAVTPGQKVPPVIVPETPAPVPEPEIKSPPPGQSGALGAPPTKAKGKGAKAKGKAIPR